MTFRITSAEARELMSTSEEVVKFWLDKIHLKIKEAAMLNKRVYRSDFLDSTGELFGVSLESFLSAPPCTPLQTRIMEELRKFPYNFQVTWAAGESRPSGGGLGDLDDTPPEQRPHYRTWAIEVKW